MTRTTPPRLRSVGRTLAVEVAYYGSLGAITLLIAWWSIGLFDQPIGIPLSYSGDALSGAMEFKDVLENGWYEFNPALGAPFGQHFHDFPQADNLHLVWAWVLGLASRHWATVWNGYYALTYPLCALAGTWFMRAIGASRVSAFVAGMLFALAPYHIYRSEGHLFLAAYYPVPLAAMVVYRLLAGEPVWTVREGGSRLNPLRWVTKRSVSTLLCLAIVGTASSYYSVFTVILICFALMAALTRSDRWRTLVAGIFAMGFLMVVMLINMAPDILWKHGKPVDYLGFSRQQIETEIYALKLSQLLLPTNLERISWLRNLRTKYDATFPLPSEEPMLGMVAAAGLVMLLIIAGLAAVRLADQGRAPGRPSATWSALHRLGYLALVTLLTGTVGGIGTLFALFISDSIRGWNRISIFIALFATAAVALAIDGAARRAARRLPQRNRVLRSVPVAVIGAGVLAVGLFDQVPGHDPAVSAQLVDQWNSDKAFVQRIERLEPSEAMILQLPYLPFPETGGREQMPDSDPFRGYAQSTDLRWSYGAIKGRPDADWQFAVTNLEPRNMLAAAAAAGFDGIWIEPSGLTPGEQLPRQIGAVLQEKPIRSRKHDLLFFDLRPFAARLKSANSSSTLAQLKTEALHNPVMYWERDFDSTLVSTYAENFSITARTANPALIFDNPQSGAATMEVTLTPSVTVTATLPDGSTSVLTAGVPATLSVQAPPGRSELRFQGPQTLGFSGVSTRVPLLERLARTVAR